jgi:hypothetical protein
MLSEQNFKKGDRKGDDDKEMGGRTARKERNAMVR